MKSLFEYKLANALLLAVAVVASSLLSGCQKAHSAATQPESGAPAHAPSSEAAVELSPGQLSAIKIEPIGTYHFPVQCEAVGSVSFDEDPTIVQAESTLMGAAAALDLANKTLARLQDLGATNGIAQKDLEQAVSTQRTSEATFMAARDALRALGKTDPDMDAMIAAGKIPPPPQGKHWIVANVSESDIALVHVGQTVRASLTASSGRVFEGTVSRVYNLVDPNTHRVAVRCEVADERNELRPGMLVDVLICLEDPLEATALPADGLVRESDGTITAWVTADRRRFVQKTIKTGLRNGGYVQVVEGLQRGELAVTKGAVFLSNMLNAPPGD